VGGEISRERCACGNAAALRCDECRAGVCRLCVRKTASGELCLACRAGQIERSEDRERAARRSARVPRATRVRQRLIFLPFAVAVALAGMTAVALSFLADAREAHAERQAESELHAIVEAEQAAVRGGGEFLTLEELQRRRLVGTAEVQGYEIKLELARDRKRFWARAVPRRTGLRGLCLDERGVLSYEGG
jgi:hypothetical protein